jgi:hypothetical protein
MPVKPVRLKTCPRDPGWSLTRQIEALADGHARVILKRERPWASITFAGTRHSFAIDWEGAVDPDEIQKLAEALPDHEFSIPGHFVADMLVTDQSEMRLLVEALSIIDPLENARD